jgi:hypothetical protein
MECSEKPALWLACIVMLLALPHISRAAGNRVPKGGDQVPKYNVKENCGAAEDATGFGEPGQTTKNCILDENEALKSITEKWSTFKPATRRTCVEAGARPNPSYVELITCLEMFDNKMLPTMKQ